MKKNDKISITGFTLIELLVVIAIVGLLASVLLMTLNNARIKARDVKRKSDAAQLAKALALYYDSNQSKYPLGPISTVNGDWPAAFKQQMEPFVSALPKDPLANNLNRFYEILLWPSSICKDHYVILVVLEDAANMSPSDNTCDYPTNFGWVFQDLGAP